jgi:hypothetical protein
VLARSWGDAEKLARKPRAEPKRPDHAERLMARQLGVEALQIVDALTYAPSVAR